MPPDFLLDSYENYAIACDPYNNKKRTKTHSQLTQDYLDKAKQLKTLLISRESDLRHYIPENDWVSLPIFGRSFSYGRSISNNEFDERIRTLVWLFQTAFLIAIDRSFTSPVKFLFIFNIHVQLNLKEVDLMMITNKVSFVENFSILFTEKKSENYLTELTRLKKLYVEKAMGILAAPTDEWFLYYVDFIPQKRCKFHLIDIEQSQKGLACPTSFQVLVTLTYMRKISQAGAYLLIDDLEIGDKYTLKLLNYFMDGEIPLDKIEINMVDNEEWRIK